MLPEDASYPELSYSSSDEAVAKVTADGKIQALSPGNAVISATASNGIAAKLTLEIFAVPVQSITLDIENTQISQKGYLCPGDCVEPVVKIQPEDAAYTGYMLVSSDENVIKISQGQLQAIGTGSAVVTVRSEQDRQITDSLTLTVQEEEKAASPAAAGILLLIAAVGCGTLFFRRLKKKDSA